MSELESLRKRCDALQGQLNDARREVEKLRQEVGDLQIQNAMQAEEIAGLELGYLPLEGPSLPLRAYVPLPEWDQPQWRASA